MGIGNHSEKAASTLRRVLRKSTIAPEGDCYNPPHQPSRAMTEPSTPLMRQYAAIKKEHPNALLFFRLGDFYELFYEDAVIAARELQITLTSRSKEKETSVPMCGVPYHAAEN